MAGLDLEETPISMEVELPAAEALLQSSALPNPLRKQRRHLLIWALIWALLAAVSGGLSAGLAPECVDPVPRRICCSLARDCAGPPFFSLSLESQRSRETDALEE